MKPLSCGVHSPSEPKLLVVPMAQFHMTGLNTFRKINRSGQQGLFSGFRFRQDSACIQKRERRKKTAKKPTLLPNDRKNASYTRIVFCHQIVSGPPKTIFDDLLPIPVVAIGALNLAVNKFLPALSVVLILAQIDFHPH